MISHESPSENIRQNTKFKGVLFGEGWKEKAVEPTDQHVIPPDNKMVVEVILSMLYR